MRAARRQFLEDEGSAGRRHELREFLSRRAALFGGIGHGIDDDACARCVVVCFEREFRAGYETAWLDVWFDLGDPTVEFWCMHGTRRHRYGQRLARFCAFDELGIVAWIYAKYGLDPVERQKAFASISVAMSINGGLELNIVWQFAQIDEF